MANILQAQITSCRARINMFKKTSIKEYEMLKEHKKEMQLDAEKLHSYLTPYDTILWDNSLFTPAEKLAIKILDHRKLIVASIKNNWVGVADQTKASIAVWQQVDLLLWHEQLSAASFSRNPTKACHNQFKRDVEEIIKNLRDIINLCNDVVTILNRFWKNYPKITFPGWSKHLLEVCSLCSFEKLQIENLLCLEKEIVQNSALSFVQQPSPVLLKKSTGGLFGTNKERNNDKTSTQTSLSFQLITLFGDLKASTKILLTIWLATEHQANTFINGEADASLTTDTRIHSKGISKTPQKSIVVQMKYNKNDQTFYATIPDISVSELCMRKKKDANGQRLGAVAAKYYFVASVVFPYENFGKLNARARSSPVVIRTHSSQTSEALATASMSAHFSSPGVLFPESRTTATITQIGQVMNLHFLEWTGGLHLKAGHLEFLKEMLLNDVFSKQSQFIQSMDRFQENVSLTSFYFENMNGQSYSQFTWFRECVQMLKFNCLKALYASNCFEAFISTEKAEELLTGMNSERVAGDFILKFSRSNLSEIGAVFVKPDKGISVYAFQLNTKSESTFQNSFEENIYLQSRSGKDAFLSLYQHPHNIPKEQVVSSPKKQEERRKKYVFPRITVDVY